MSDQDTDSSGVLQDDETADPSANINAPDPLLGEQARSGALSAPAKTIGTKGEAQQTAAARRSNMEMLQQQYGNVQQGLTGAYKNQAKALQDARDRLLATPVGPSAQEAAYAQAASIGATPGYNPSDTAKANQDILQARREAEMQKQTLLAAYGMQGAGAQIGQYGAMGNALIQRMRIAAGEEKSADTMANKDVQAKPASMGTPGVVWNPNKPNADGTVGAPEYHPDIAAAVTTQKANDARAVQAAKFAGAQLSAGSMDPKQIEFAASYLHDNMKMPPGYNARLSNGMVNPVTTAIYKKMAEMYPNESPTQIMANAGMVSAAQGVLKGFSSGKEAQSIQALQTGIAHVDVFKNTIAALDNTNFPAANFVKNWWAQNMQGKPQPNDFNGVRAFVTGEISKAVFPAGGGEEERQQLLNQARQAGSRDELNSIVAKWHDLLVGKVTNGLKSQWDVGTMGRFDKQGGLGFYDRLSPQTRAYLGITQQPQIVQPQGATPAPAAGGPPQPAAASGWSARIVQPQQPAQ